MEKSSPATKPILRATLSGPSELKFAEKFCVTVTITYVGVSPPTPTPAPTDADAPADAPPAPPARPITIHTWPLSQQNQLELSRQRRPGGGWEEVEQDEGCGGFGIFDDPDVWVAAGAHEDFVSLAPGASWRATHAVHPGSWAWTSLPWDARDGERLRCRFVQAGVDWWAWGAKEEHEGTRVRLPCWVRGPVLDEATGKIRKRKEGDPPEVIVEESEPLEFVLSIPESEVHISHELPAM